MSKTNFVVDKENLEVKTERIFDAPIDRLWQAYSDPTQIPKWWGPRNLSTTIETLDFRVGGAWRFVQRDPEGKEYAFRGVFKEINEPSKISRTFEFEPMPGHILLETATLEELGGKTKVTSTARYENLADLEGMVAMGMEEGELEGMDRLAELVE